MTLELHQITSSLSILFLVAVLFLIWRNRKLGKDLSLQINENLVLNERNQSLYAQLDQFQIDNKNIQETLKNEFKVLAQSVMDENSKQMSLNSKKSLSEVILPLNENISLFKSRLEELNSDRIKDTTSFKVELEHFKHLNSQIIGETSALTSALKGDKKAQGDWGEISLKRLLEASGLRDGHEYTYQSVGKNLKDDEGNLLLPDVLVNLPDNKALIIDSKVSLVDYLGIINSQTQSESDSHRLKLFSAVKNHIDGLSKKSYESLGKINGPEFVFMFFPLEGALSLIAEEKVKGHPGLSFLEYAWNKRVVICTPTTLYTNLKTVSILWSHAHQDKNQQEVFDLAAKVYDRFSDLINNLLNVKTKIAKSNKELDESISVAVNHGRGIAQTLEKMKHKGLGHKVKKTINNELFNDSEVN